MKSAAQRKEVLISEDLIRDLLLVHWNVIKVISDGDEAQLVFKTPQKLADGKYVFPAELIIGNKKEIHKEQEVELIVLK